MPMYSSTTKDLAGYGHVALNFHPDKGFQTISIGVSAKRYAYSNVPFDLNYNRIAPELFLRVKKAHLASPGEFDIRFRNITTIVDRYYTSYSWEPFYDPTPRLVHDHVIHNYDVLDLKYTHNDAITPYSVNLDLQYTKDVVDIAKAGLTFNYSYNFKKKNKGIDIRIFAGTFLTEENIAMAPYRFNLSGQAPFQDYLF